MPEDEVGYTVGYTDGVGVAVGGNVSQVETRGR